MPKNSDIIGAALLLLLLSNRQSQGTSISQLNKLLNSFEINSIINELHRLSHIINRLDNLGQMALNALRIAELEKFTPLISSLINSEDENQNAIF